MILIHLMIIFLFSLSQNNNYKNSPSKNDMEKVNICFNNNLENENEEINNNNRNNSSKKNKKEKKKKKRKI